MPHTKRDWDFVIVTNVDSGSQTDTNLSRNSNVSACHGNDARVCHGRDATVRKKDLSQLYLKAYTNVETTILSTFSVLGEAVACKHLNK